MRSVNLPNIHGWPRYVISLLDGMSPISLLTTHEVNQKPARRSDYHVRVTIWRMSYNTLRSSIQKG